MIFKGSANQHVLEHKILQGISLYNSPLRYLCLLSTYWNKYQYSSHLIIKTCSLTIPD